MQLRKKILYFLGDITLNLVILVALVFVIRTYFITPFRVYGPSMCDTINYIDGKCTYEFGEYLIVDKFSFQNFFGWQVSTPKRGDIIVFHPPDETNHQDESYIKRVIGLPGDTVKLQGGSVYIYNTQYPNGVQLDEPYLNERNASNTQTQQFNLDEFVVPEDKYFVMGDNRVASTDSRSCFRRKFSNSCSDGSAFLTMDHIQGRAWLSLWPLQKIRKIEHADYPGLD